MIRLVIFDLDDTLHQPTHHHPNAKLLGGQYRQLCPTTLPILNYLAQHHIHMAICSYNHQAKKWCDEFHISHYFRIILGDSAHHPKSQMIQTILTAFPEYRPSEILFLDDQLKNIQDVFHVLSLPSLLVPFQQGIPIQWIEFFIKIPSELQFRILWTQNIQSECPCIVHIIFLWRYLLRQTWKYKKDVALSFFNACRLYLLDKT